MKKEADKVKKQECGINNWSDKVIYYAHSLTDIQCLIYFYVAN